eukprot:TRINITY_DN475993_c0_g1_i1.p2 TRINITY_DN475993_c0_g1~~TRINITY_DN475993_c0_g1_i1.p2  ORF type:complete len:127 (-),score=26.15 TRINITY_DN475993_c0_g1_i1:86-466(-)
MVVKCQTCTFSGLKIYPGHGSSFVQKDATLQIVLNGKCKSLVLGKKKAQDVTWCPAWRLANNKMQDVSKTKKRTKRATKAARAFGAVSLDRLKAMRSATFKNEAKALIAKEASKKKVKKVKKTFVH